MRSRIVEATQLLIEAGALDFARRVARHHGVSLRAVLSGSRLKNVTAARREMVVVTRDTLGLSLQETAAMFGLKDHTSVFQATKRRRKETEAAWISTR